MEFTMKKILLAAAISAAFATAAQANTQSNAVDHAQPRPASSVKAEVSTVTETVTTTTQGGTTTAEQTVEVSAPVAVIAESTAESVLPAAMVTDASMDLEKTMKVMGRNFKALSKADDLLAMKKEADELAVYASQGEAIGLDPNKASDEAKAEYVRLMQKLRSGIADLQQAIEQKDADKAKAALEAVNDTRKEGHKYFDI